MFRFGVHEKKRETKHRRSILKPFVSHLAGLERSSGVRGLGIHDSLLALVRQFPLSWLSSRVTPTTRVVLRVQDINSSTFKGWREETLQASKACLQIPAKKGSTVLQKIVSNNSTTQVSYSTFSFFSSSMSRKTPKAILT